MSQSNSRSVPGIVQKGTSRSQIGSGEAFIFENHDQRFWSMRAAEVRNSVAERLEGITSDAYLTAVAILNTPGLSEEQKTSALADLATDQNLDAADIREVVEATAPKEWFRKFGRAIVEMSKEEPTKVVIRFVRHDDRGKSAGEFKETLIWIKEDDGWNCVDMEY